MSTETKQVTILEGHCPCCGKLLEIRPHRSNPFACGWCKQNVYGFRDRWYDEPPIRDVCEELASRLEDVMDSTEDCEPAIVDAVKDALVGIGRGDLVADWEDDSGTD